MFNLYNINHQLENKRGFTIIEFMVSFGILTLIIASMLNILNYSLKASSRGKDMDELLLNGRFGVEYIKEELRNSDKLISADNIPNLNTMYPDNIGFVIFKDSGVEGSDTRYNFSTYYSKDNKLIRIAINKKSPSYPEAKNLAGFNELSEGVISISNTRTEVDNKLVFLDISMGYDIDIFHSFKACLYLEKDFDFKEVP